MNPEYLSKRDEFVENLRKLIDPKLTINYTDNLVEVTYTSPSGQDYMTKIRLSPWDFVDYTPKSLAKFWANRITIPL
jgi:hypothetical protein